MKRYIMIPALLLMAVAACNKSTEAPGPQTEKETGAPVNFISNAQGGDTKVTLDGLDLKWAAGDKIAVYSYKGAETTPTGKDICDLSSGAGTASGTFTPETSTLGTNWVKDGVAEDVYTFYSWYPASANPTGSSETVANVAAAQSEGHLGEYLICWDQANETKTRAQVITGITPAFSYSPRVALLKVAIQNTSGGSITVNSITVKTSSGYIAGNVTLGVMDGSISGGSSSSITYTPASPIELANGATSAVHTIALLPNAGSITVTASTDAGGAFTFSSNSLASAVAAGCCYTVTPNITHYEPKTLPTAEMMADGSVYYGEANCVVMPVGTTSVDLDVSLYDAGDNHARGSRSSLYRSAAKSAKVIWHEAGLVLNTPTLENENEVWTMTLTATTNTGGNALVGLYDGENGTGNLLWSFHVWAPGQTGSNLIAENVADFAHAYKLALGQVTGATDTYMYYQWGRKDPLGRAADYGDHKSELFGMSGELKPNLTSDSGIVGGPKSLDVARQNPTVFYTNSSSPYDWISTQDDALWNTSSSTIYDPCPVGYHVPSTALWSGIGAGSGTPIQTTCAGLTYTSGGCRSYSDGSVYLVGTYGYCWSGSVYGVGGVNLYFDSDNVYPEYTNYRAYGRAVRCVQN